MTTTPSCSALHSDGVVEQHRTKVQALLATARQDGRPLFISAPMVRYSKLPFRLLVRDYHTDIIYTPMILAAEFIRSQFARDSDFTTCRTEREPTSDGRQHALIAQFAATNPTDFARAAELVAPYVDGVNLNCGCPQSWAIKEGIGCALMSSPALVASIVKAAKAKVPASCSVSCKIRIAKDLDKTRQWIRTVEDAGVDYITIHGRLRSQRSSTPPDYEAIKTLKGYAKVPIFANGDCYSLEDAMSIAKHTGVDGVMAARGLLENPSLFAGNEKVTKECLRRFLDHTIASPIPYPLVLHHVGELINNMGVSKDVKRQLQECRDLLDIIDFVDDVCQDRG